MDSHHKHETKKADPTPKLKTTRCTVVGGNTDGQKLYMEIDAFDGEHTNKFFPEFPYSTSSEEISDYMKKIIDDNPKLPPEIVQMMQTGISWSAEDDCWMIHPQNGGPATPEKKEDKHKSTK